MDNSKKNVHSSGPLGMLMKSGLVRRIEGEKPTVERNKHLHEPISNEDLNSYFKTDSGIKFKADELTQIDPNECAPWEYANRSQEEMGDIEELMESIKTTSQLQPALVRIHPRPNSKYKYEVIFGRRRLEACNRLGIKLLAIKKNQLSDQEAIICQHSENKLRSDVSNFSNAMLYKRLLDNKAFANEKALAKSLSMSTSGLNDILSFSRIPSEILNALPNVHQLPINMAVKIVRLAHQFPLKHNKLVALAKEIGTKIKSPMQLEKLLLEESISQNAHSEREISVNHEGKVIGKITHTKTGAFVVKFSNKTVSSLNQNKFIEELTSLVLKSGAPDL